MIDSITGRDRHEVVTERDPQSGDHLSRLVRLSPIPTELSAIVGDCLHNLRSALDHLADGLIRVAGLVPTRATIFPILTERPAYGLFIAPSPGPGPQVIEAVESLQPYTTSEGGAHPLAFLDELNRVDKHRQLLFAIIALEGATWGLDAGIASPRVRVRTVPLKVGDVVARFSFDEEFQGDFDPDFDLEVRLDKRGDFDARAGDHAIDRLLSSMVFVVEDVVVPRLAEFLT